MPVDAGRKRLALGCGSPTPASSLDSSSLPAASSPSSVSSSASRSTSLARKPVRYQRDGLKRSSSSARWSGSSWAAGSNGPTRSAWRARTRCSRAVGLSEGGVAGMERGQDTLEGWGVGARCEVRGGVARIGRSPARCVGDRAISLRSRWATRRCSARSGGRAPCRRTPRGG